MQECVFCRIARGEIPVQLLWDTPAVAAFRDANPQAPIHILIVPKKHIPSLDALQEGFTVRILTGMCAAVDNARGDKAFEEMEKAGAELV